MRLEGNPLAPVGSAARASAAAAPGGQRASITNQPTTPMHGLATGGPGC